MVKKPNKEKFKYVIGIDEVGRGPLAGPVTVCAFAVPVQYQKELDSIGARDSKKLSAQKREAIAAKLLALKRQGKCFYQIASSSSHVIDRKGITRAISIALASALKKIGIHPRDADVYLDGSLYAPESYFRQHTVIGGDGKIPVISCASIVAKVHRDALMDKMDLTYPHYGFLDNKGYGTRDHYRAIKSYGLTSIHRLSFLRSILE